MTVLDQLGVLLTDLPIYLANGVLVILYWLAAHSAALVSLACALTDHPAAGCPDPGKSRLPPSRHEDSRFHRANTAHRPDHDRNRAGSLG